MTHEATTSAPCVISLLVSLSGSTARAELIEVSAEFSAKLHADFVAARCNHRQRWPKNWRREGFELRQVTLWISKLLNDKYVPVPCSPPKPPFSPPDLPPSDRAFTPPDIYRDPRSSAESE